MRSMMHLGGRLFLIALVAGLALGATYHFTKEPIAYQQAIATAGARATVIEGVALPDESATNVDEDANAAAATNPASSFIARNPGRVAGGGEFDDIVVWLSPNILCSRLLAAGRLP